VRRVQQAFAALLCGLVAGCAGGPVVKRPDQQPPAPAAAQPRPPEKLELPQAVITVSKEDLELTGFDDTQLFDCGTRAFSAADYPRAARCFDRLVGLFPQSQSWGASLFNAGLAQERMAAWPAALERWERYLARFAGAPSAAGADEADATFHAAFAEHELGERQKAAARLQALAVREGLPPARKGEALVQEAVCLIEAAELARQAGSKDVAVLHGRAEGERTLRAALALYDKAGDGEVDPALLAQAEFWMGELYRSYFAEVAIDPAAVAEQGLADALESKAQFLLSAQGHYLRAIRRGDGEWATASGFRVGELYEALHQEMTAAPLPPGLTAEEARAYREELKKKVRVLLGKAMKIYEQTFATARRVNARSAFVEKTEAALARMRALLLEVQPQEAPTAR
jgi:tetratricopeptide (TPR) repeat protein